MQGHVNLPETRQPAANLLAGAACVAVQRVVNVLRVGRAQARQVRVELAQAAHFAAVAARRVDGVKHGHLRSPVRIKNRA